MSDAVKEVHDCEGHFANPERRLDEVETVCNDDKETIRRFVTDFRAQGVSTGRLVRYTYCLKNAVERFGAGGQLTWREDIERPVP
ncbi:MAG: hypothetical protein QW767_06340 [Thermoprotei archaeon]